MSIAGVQNANSQTSFTCTPQTKIAVKEKIKLCP
jgi:hypothetical protein